MQTSIRLRHFSSSNKSKVACSGISGVNITSCEVCIKVVCMQSFFTKAGEITTGIVWTINPDLSKTCN